MLIAGRYRGLLALLAAAGIAAGVLAAHESADAHRRPPRTLVTGAAPVQPQTPFGQKPNIVFVLTDDLSMNLLKYMPQVQQMQQDGLTFNDYFVSDSLCCPSRASIFSGSFPHDTHVFSNVGPTGGFRVFHNRGEEQHTFAVALQRAGYRTALMGKYLNGYLQHHGNAVVPRSYVPPGWSEWDVAGYGYQEFNYNLNQNGSLVHYGRLPDDYMTDVIARKGVKFIDDAAASGQPFFLELGTFSPHAPFVPAPRDAGSFGSLTAPRTPNFDVLPTNAPTWLAGHPPLTSDQIARIDEVYRLRVEDVQSVDNMIGEIKTALAANGVSDNTYVIFSSDNGLHTGEFRLMPGKLTAFDTDIHVPLVVDGPGVPAGASTDAMAENIDLADTFAEIGGTEMDDNDGHSLLPLLRGETPVDWRNVVLIEHRGPDLQNSDPDYQAIPAGNPTTYEAMRTHDFLYVEYRDGEHEFYDLRNDPFELHNLAGDIGPAELAELHSELLGLELCHGSQECWSAMHLPQVAGALRFARRPFKLRRSGHLRHSLRLAHHH
jgi:arylsulfatase A-like enzyme